MHETDVRIKDRCLEVGTTDVRIVTPEEDTAAALPPLILFNGIGAGVNHWADFPEALNRPVVAINVATKRYAGTIATMHNYATKAAEAIEKIGAGPLDVLGYSWGGLLLQQLAIDYPDHVGRLIFAATCPSVQCGIPSVGAMIGFLSHDRSPQHLQKIAGDMYGGDIRHAPELVRTLGLVRDVHPPTYRKQQIAALSCGVNFLRLPLINKPSLVMAGDDDPIAPFANALVLRSLLPLAEICKVHKGGHGFLLTRAQESAARIVTFLAAKR